MPINANISSQFLGPLMARPQIMDPAQAMAQHQQGLMGMQQMQEKQRIMGLQPGVRQTLQDQFSTGDPDKFKILGALAQTEDPLKVAQASGLFSAGKGMTGNFMQQMQNRQAASQIAGDIEGLITQADQLASSGGDIRPILAQIGQQQSKFFEFTGKNWEGDLISRNKFLDLQRKQAQAAKEMTIKESKEAREAQEFAENQAMQPIEIKDKYTERGRKWAKTSATALDAFERVKDLYKDAKTGNSTSQNEMVTNMKKMSDASQVLLSEMEASLTPGTIAALRRLAGKEFDQQAMLAEDYEGAYRTALAISQSLGKEMDSITKAINKQANAALKAVGEPEDYDFNESMGFTLPNVKLDKARSRIGGVR